MNYDSEDELLSAYLDGELTADEQASVEKRLGESAELRQLYDDLRALRVSFESLPIYRLPHDLGSQVLRRAERAMLSNPGPIGQNAPVQNPAAPDSLAAAVGSSTHIDKTLADTTLANGPAGAPLGGLRMPRGLRPWLWAAASIAAAVLMMTNAERPEPLNEREVALNRGAKGPSDMAFTAVPSKETVGVVAENRVEEGVASAGRREASNRFSDLSSSLDSKRMLKSGDSLDDSVDADTDSALSEKLAVDPAGNSKSDAKHSGLGAEDAATKRESLARKADSPLIRSKIPAERSRVAQSERTIRRSRQVQPAHDDSNGETREFAGGNGAGGFGGGRGELRKSALGQSALALTGAVPTRFALGYHSAETQRLADRLLASTALPKGVAREDVAVVELQISPAAAQSGAFHKLLSDNHIALADGFSRHGELAGESAQQVDVATDFRNSLSGQAVEEATSDESAIDKAIDSKSEVAEKSQHAKQFKRKDESNGKDSVAETFSGKADVSKAAKQFGSQRIADKLELGKPAPGNDVAAKPHSLERSPDAGGTGVPSNAGALGGEGANVAKKRFENDNRSGAGKPAARGGAADSRGALANQENAPAKVSERVQLKSAEAMQADVKQYAEPESKVGLKNQTAGTAQTGEPRVADARGRDTAAGESSDDASGQDSVGGRHKVRLHVRADNLASTWAYEAVLVEADAADVLSTMSQLEAQPQEFVQLAVSPAEVRATHDFFFDTDPAVTDPVVTDESFHLGTSVEGHVEQDADMPRAVEAVAKSPSGAPPAAQSFATPQIPPAAADRAGDDATKAKVQSPTGPPQTVAQGARKELPQAAPAKKQVTENSAKSLAGRMSGDKSVSGQERTSVKGREPVNREEQVKREGIAKVDSNSGFTPSQAAPGRATNGPQGAASTAPKVAARAQISPAQPSPPKATPDPAAPHESAPDLAAPLPAAQAASTDAPATPPDGDDHVRLRAELETSLQKEAGNLGSQRNWGRAYRLSIVPELFAEQEGLSDEYAVPGIQAPRDDVSLGVREAKDSADSQFDKAKMSAPVDGSIEDRMPLADQRTAVADHSEGLDGDHAEFDRAVADQKSDKLADQPTGGKGPASGQRPGEAGLSQSVKEQGVPAPAVVAADPATRTAPTPPAAKAPLAAKSRAARKSPAATPPKPNLAKAAPAPRAEAARSNQQRFNPPSVDAPAASAPAAPAVAGKAGSAAPVEPKPVLEAPRRPQQEATRQQIETLAVEQAATPHAATPHAATPHAATPHAAAQQSADDAPSRPDIDKLSRWHAQPPRSKDRELEESKQRLAEAADGRPLYVLFLVRVVEPENSPTAQAGASAATVEATEAEVSPNEAEPADTKPVDKKSATTPAPKAPLP